MFMEYFPRSERKSEAQIMIFALQDKLVLKEYLSAKMYYDLGTYTGNASMNADGQIRLLHQLQPIVQIAHLSLPQGIPFGVQHHVGITGGGYGIPHYGKQIPQGKGDGKIDIFLLRSVCRHGAAVGTAVPRIDQNMYRPLGRCHRGRLAGGYQKIRI